MNEHLNLPQTYRYSQWRFMKVRDRLTPQAGQQRKGVISLPPPLLVFLSIISVQLGAAFAKSLFQTIGSGGIVFLRVGFAAIVLLLMWRPRVRQYTPANYALIMLFGLTIAVMNAAFYAAIARIPLGIAVTLEFVGPLGIAVAASRSRRDLLWAGLALSMSVAALVLIPLGVGSGRGMLLNPKVLLVGVGVAVLSTIIPFSLELEALRRLPARVFGVLMSLEPVIAALIGFVVLRETIGLRALVALILIIVASGGVSFFQQRDYVE